LGEGDLRRGRWRRERSSLGQASLAGAEGGLATRWVDSEESGWHFAEFFEVVWNEKEFIYLEEIGLLGSV
jgi:hypothetical protein